MIVKIGYTKFVKKKKKKTQKKKRYINYAIVYELSPLWLYL